MGKHGEENYLGKSGKELENAEEKTTYMGHLHRRLSFH